MRCDKFENRLNEILDQRLDPNQDEALRSHADECDACDDLLGTQHIVLQRIQAGGLAQTVSPAIETSSLVSLSEPKPRIGSWRTSVRVVFCLAVGLLVAVPTIPFLSRLSMRGPGTDSAPTDVSSVMTQREVPLPAIAESLTRDPFLNHSNLDSDPFVSRFDISMVSATFGADWMELAGASQWLAPVPQKLKPLADSMGSAAAVLWRVLDGESTSPHGEPQANAARLVRTMELV